MKNVPIKFRALNIETNAFITFELGECSAELRPDYLTVISDDVYTIEADTICQLVGYDDNGDEVYEGDVVTAEAGMEFVATLEPKILWTDGAEKTVDFDFENVTLRK